MNKIKTTKKEMRNNYIILGVGYCDMQHILTFESPIAYSAGYYGWACDYYLIKDEALGEVIISTGYSPIASKNMNTYYNLIREYEEKARQLNTKEEHKALLIELLNKLKEGV